MTVRKEKAALRGFGTIAYTNGTVYTGMIKNFHPHGIGRLQIPSPKDGRTIFKSGTFKNGVPERLLKVQVLD